MRNFVEGNYYWHSTTPNAPTPNPVGKTWYEENEFEKAKTDADKFTETTYLDVYLSKIQAGVNGRLSGIRPSEEWTNAGLGRSWHRVDNITRSNQS